MYTHATMLLRRATNIFFNRNTQIRAFHINQKVGILGVPFNKGQPEVTGVEKAPKFLRKSGLIERIKALGETDVMDYGDVTYSVKNIQDEVENMKEYAHCIACAAEVSKSVEKVISDGRLCLSLGGDHSMGLGTVDGHLQAKSSNVSLLWIDAHGDINTNKTSESGNVHGMPVALLAKELSDYWPYLPGLSWQKPVLSVKNIAYIGLRDVDPYERYIFDKLGMAAYSMEDIVRYGIEDVIRIALDKIDPNNDRSLHVSFDIDALDTLEAPSNIISVRGGLTLREGVFLMETIAKTNRLGAMDLFEINPDIGDTKDVRRTVEAGVQLLLAACGRRTRGQVHQHITEIPQQTFPPTRDLIK